jgi:hypothetical protein
VTVHYTQGGDRRKRAEIYMSDGRCILVDVDSSTTARDYANLFGLIGEADEPSEVGAWWVLPSGNQILNTKQIASIFVTERDA